MIALLLTACINPKGMAFTTVQDKQNRLIQYQKALDFYLTRTGYKIVFTENSGYDISNNYKEYIEQGRLEILTFNGNNYDKTLGKGYGEGQIIKYSLENSYILKSATTVVKITGRLIIKNINSLISRSKKENCVYCNLVKASSRKQTCYSIFFFAPKTFYKDYLIQNINNINDKEKYYFEHHLNDCCKQWKKDGNPWKEYFLPIIIIGQSGTSGTYYKYNYTMYIKQVIRYIAHRIGFYNI